MLVKRLQNYLVVENLSIKDFAKRCDVPATTLYSIISRKTESPRLDIVAKIAEEMNLTIDELISERKYNFDSELVKINKRLEKLSDRDKIKIYAMINALISVLDDN